MCTVTLIPQGENDFILTSNRDEAPNRRTLAPDFYNYKNIKLLYPMDELAGGSWIGISEKKRLLCVLNGGLVAHERKAKYRLSRGVVLKDLLIVDDIISAIQNYDLNGIEPFTMVIVDWNSTLQFFELVWDGEKRHCKQLPLVPAIWSSSSLYDAKMKNERMSWFQDFKTENVLDRNTILQFHKTAGAENMDYGVIMDRYYVKTTSITQVALTNATIEMSFDDLQSNVLTSQHYQLPVTINE